jgi:hypothetical protein
MLLVEIWVEYVPDLQPGARGAIRLAPLSPERWRRLAAGDTITMHERMPAARTATITEALFSDIVGRHQ